MHEQIIILKLKSLGKQISAVNLQNSNTWSSSNISLNILARQCGTCSLKKKKKNSTSLSTTYNVSKCIQINEISPNKSCLLVILPVSSYSWNAMQVYYTLLNYNEQFEWHSASQWKIRNVLLWKINHLYKVCSLCDFNESLGTIVSFKKNEVSCTSFTPI